jgi:hypothetical protein
LYKIAVPKTPAVVAGPATTVSSTTSISVTYPVQIGGVLNSD